MHEHKDTSITLNLLCQKMRLRILPSIEGTESKKSGRGLDSVDVPSSRPSLNSHFLWLLFAFNLSPSGFLSLFLGCTHSLAHAISPITPPLLNYEQIGVYIDEESRVRTTEKIGYTLLHDHDSRQRIIFSAKTVL